MSNSSIIQKRRYHAFKIQSGCCYYCNSPMWLDKKEAFAKKHSLSLKVAERLQCTAEHLVARCDNGKNTEENIVAACLFCNQNRHKRKKPPTPDKYKQDIGKRIRKGKWFLLR